MDIAHQLATELTFSTGLLPVSTLWWSNTRGGPIFAVYEEPRIRTLALQTNPSQPPLRFKIPLPGFIFLLRPGIPPWVYAVKRKPTKETDIVYHAPLANVYNNGRTCGGTNKYPTRVNEMVESFFISFFSAAADVNGRSTRFPQDVIHLWEFLNKKKRFPMEDLVRLATVRDLMNLEISR